MMCRSPPWGNRVIRDIPLTEIFPYINTVALFRGQWGFRRGRRSKAEFEQSIEEEARPVFKELQQSFLEDNVLEPSLVYGWYPCGSDGEDLVVFDPEDHDRELERFSFPRQRARRRLCISDYFKDVSAGERDVLGLSCVTVGHRVRSYRRLFADNEYSRYLYVHGMVSSVPRRWRNCGTSECGRRSESMEMTIRTSAILPAEVPWQSFLIRLSSLPRHE